MIHLIGALDRLSEAYTWRQVMLDRRQNEQQMRRVMVRLLRHQGRDLVSLALPGMRSQLRESLSPLVEQRIIDILESVAEQYREIILAVLLAAATRAYASTLSGLGLGIAFDLPTLEIRRILGDQSARLITAINETTRGIVRQVLIDGVEASHSYSQIARDLRSRFVQFAPLRPQRHIRDRATLIAVTEIGNAYTEGQLQLGRDMQQRGLAMEKSWLTVRDERVDSSCAGNEAAGWIPLDAAFPSGHMGPLDHPGCRCALLMRRVQT